MQVDRQNQWAVAESGSIPAGFVAISGFRMATNGRVRQVEFPHSAITMVFQLGASVLVSPTGAESEAPSVVVGLTSGPVATEMSGQIDCIEVRLTPPAAYELFGGAPMSELSDQAIDTAHLSTFGTGQLLDPATLNQSWSERFEATVRALASTEQRHRTADAEVWEAWELLQATGGQMTVAELCRRTGWSAKRLRSRFGQQVGMTPKRAARLIRFENAHCHLRQGADLTAIAAECGFVDQSHMHREVKSFTGLTLSELVGSAG